MYKRQGQADAATVARWLVLQEEARAGFRYMANALSLIHILPEARELVKDTRAFLQDVPKQTQQTLSLIHI